MGTWVSKQHVAQMITSAHSFQRLYTVDLSNCSENKIWYKYTWLLTSLNNNHVHEVYIHCDATLLSKVTPGNRLMKVEDTDLMNVYTRLIRNH